MKEKLQKIKLNEFSQRTLGMSSKVLSAVGVLW